MSQELLISIITLLGSFCGTFSGIRLMSYRIAQLEKTVAELNSLVERMAVTENKISVAEHRIYDLEEQQNRNKI